MKLEHALIEIPGTRQVDAREEEGSDRFGGEDGRFESHQETGGREPESDDEPGFQLDRQSEADLKAEAGR